MQYMGSEYAPPVFPPTPPRLTPPPSFSSGYLQPCYDIVTCARHIANPITVSIPELYVLGSFAPRLDRRLRLIRRVGEHVRGWGSDVEEGVAFERVEWACCGAARGWRCKSWTRLLRISRRLWRKRGMGWRAERRWLRCTVSLCRLLVPPRTPRWCCIRSWKLECRRPKDHR